MQTGNGRGAGARRLIRVVGIGVVAACVLLVPGVASAKPINPSDGQINAAQSAKDAAAKKVGDITAQLAKAQAQVDAAHAASAIALDAFEGKQAEYEQAQASAQAAAAAAQQAQADLADARKDVAAFARSSYIDGTTSPGIVALVSSSGPTQLLERAALLQAAGTHRTDVLAQVTVAEHKAEDTRTQAQTALAKADTLKQQAQQALTVANAAEISARQQQAQLTTQQAQAQTELNQANQTLLGVEGARAAAVAYEQQQAAEAAAEEQAQQQAQQDASSGNDGDQGGDPGPTNDSSAGAGSASAADTAIAAAKRYLGTRYAWGGGSLTGPSVGWGIDAGVVGFDCSGLTRYAYAQAGIIIPRNSSAQYAALPKVSRSNLQPGDLVFWATDTRNPATIHHVAIWLGGNQIIEAPESGMTVRITSMRWWGYIGAVRPSA